MVHTVLCVLQAQVAHAKNLGLTNCTEKIVNSPKKRAVWIKLETSLLEMSIN